MLTWPPEVAGLVVLLVGCALVLAAIDLPMHHPTHDLKEGRDVRRRYDGRRRSPGGAMRYRILGPVEIHHAGRTLTPDRAQRRGLLGYLLLNANRLVSQDTVTEALWGGAPPTTARNQVHSAIHVVRRLLRDADCERSLISRAGGYILQVDPDDIDAARFQRLVAEAGAAVADDRPIQAQALLREALGLWRGPALADASGAFVDAARARLADQQLTAIEDLIDVELGLGRHTEVIAEFASLVDDHPIRERLRGQIMLALYRSGRPVDALRQYQALRRVLAEEQGLDPGQALRDLEQAILQTDASLDLPEAVGTAVPRPETASEPRPAEALPESEPVRPAPIEAVSEPRSQAETKQPEEAPSPPRQDQVVHYRLSPLPDGGPGTLLLEWLRSRSPRTLTAMGAAILVLVVGGLLLTRWLGGRSAADGDGPRSATPATVAIVNDGPPDAGETPHVIGIVDPTTTEAPGVRLSVWAADSAGSIRSQVWSAEDNGANQQGVTRWSFRNLTTGDCLDRDHGEEAQVIQADCADTTSQLWYFDSTGALVNEADGRCLGIEDGGWREGANLRMEQCGTAWSQRWYMTVRRDFS